MPIGDIFDRFQTNRQVISAQLTHLPTEVPPGDNTTNRQLSKHINNNKDEKKTNK